MPNFYFLKFEGGAIDIKGSSIAENHKDEIIVKSFAFGQIQEATNARVERNVKIRDLVVRFEACKATPLLFLACASATKYTKVTLTCVTTLANKTQDYQKWTLEGEVLISQYKQVGSEDKVDALLPSQYTDVTGVTSAQPIGPISLNAVTPMEEIHLSFQSVKNWFRQQVGTQLEAPVEKGWDKVKNGPTS